MVVVGVPVSAFTAAGPVTSTCRPPPARLAGPATAPRIARTAAVSALAWLFASAVMFAVNTAACPSADRWAGLGVLSPLTCLARRATAVRAEVIAVISAAVRPLLRANTTNAVSV